MRAQDGGGSGQAVLRSQALGPQLILMHNVCGSKHATKCH